MSWVPNFMKIEAHFNFGTKFARIYNFGSTSSIPSTNTKFALTRNFIKRSSIAINILITSMFDLLWVPNYIKIWHIGILIFLVVTARYLVVIARYLVLTARYWWLLLVPTISINAALSIVFEKYIKLIHFEENCRPTASKFHIKMDSFIGDFSRFR